MKEFDYLILLEALNMKYEDSCFSLSKNENGNYIIEGEFNDEAISVPADFLLNILTD